MFKKAVHTEDQGSVPPELSGLATQFMTMARQLYGDALDPTNAGHMGVIHASDEEGKELDEIMVYAVASHDNLAQVMSSVFSHLQGLTHEWQQLSPRVLTYRLLQEAPHPVESGQLSFWATHQGEEA